MTGFDDSAGRRVRPARRIGAVAGVFAGLALSGALYVYAGIAAITASLPPTPNVATLPVSALPPSSFFCACFSPLMMSSRHNPATGHDFRAARIPPACEENADISDAAER